MSFKKVWDNYREGRSIKYTIQYILFNTLLFMITFNIIIYPNIDYEKFIQYNPYSSIIITIMLLTINHIILSIFDKDNYMKLLRKSW